MCVKLSKHVLIKQNASQPSEHKQTLAHLSYLQADEPYT